jgi:two-component system, OmpR family, aerobic respiration control sensor histidine kinase ArcB
MSNKRLIEPKIQKQLEQMAEMVPVPFYWLDTNQVILGANRLALKSIGIDGQPEKAIGYTAHDIYPKEFADQLVANQRKVIKTNQPLTTEETITNMTTGRIQYYQVTLAPLHNDHGQIIGVYGVSIEVTERKKAEYLHQKNQIKKAKLAQLEEIANTIPVPFYWLDTQQVVLGANSLTVEGIGIGDSPESLIGYTAHDIYPKEIADKLVANQCTVIKTNQPLTTEEVIKNVSTNQIQYCKAILAPLHDDHGNIIGTYGVSIDITAEKEVEKLKIENTKHKAELEAQHTFTQIASQVAHDIRSPLASLSMILKSCDDIPEDRRIALREAANSINDIANSLLKRFQVDDSETLENAESAQETEVEKALLLSTTLMQLLTDKKYEYPDAQWNLNIENDAHFVFIHAKAIDIKRALSNLINNAIDAADSLKSQK